MVKLFVLNYFLLLATHKKTIQYALPMWKEIIFYFENAWHAKLDFLNPLPSLDYFFFRNFFKSDRTNP